MADLFGDLPPPSTGDAKCNHLSTNTANGKRKIEPECTPTPKQPKIVSFRQKGYIGERKGEREDMQDHHTIMDDLKSQINQLKTTLCVCFDLQSPNLATFTFVFYYHHCTFPSTPLMIHHISITAPIYPTMVYSMAMLDQEQPSLLLRTCIKPSLQSFLQVRCITWREK